MVRIFKKNKRNKEIFLAPPVDNQLFTPINLSNTPPHRKRSLLLKGNQAKSPRCSHRYRRRPR